MKPLIKPILIASTFAALACSCTDGGNARNAAPVPVIFDTDLGNDIDDVLALQMLLNYEKQGKIDLIGVTLCKANPATIDFADGYLRYNDRGDIPLGYVYDGVTDFDGDYLLQTLDARVDGQPLLNPERGIESGLPEACKLLRELLAGQPDNSVVLISVGPMTNIARLLESGPDAASPLTGIELVKQKVSSVAAMAGLFAEGFDHPEWNVEMDIPSAQTVFAKCLVPLTASGFEIGGRLLYPHRSILEDFGDPAGHPLTVAYCEFMDMPYDRQTWDLTSVLDAVEPDEWFSYSPWGRVEVDERGFSSFTPDPSGR